MIAILNLTNVSEVLSNFDCLFCVSVYFLRLSVCLQFKIKLFKFSQTYFHFFPFLYSLSCISQLTLPFLMIVKNHRLFIAFDLNSIWFNLFLLETFVVDSLMPRSLLHMDYRANNNELFGWYATAQEIKQNEREVNNKTVDIVKGNNKNKMKYNATSRSLSKSN